MAYLQVSWNVQVREIVGLALDPLGTWRALALDPQSFKESEGQALADSAQIARS